MSWLAQMLSDETDSPSSKRFVGIACAATLIFALIYNLVHPAHPTPAEILVESVLVLAVSALGLTTWDKATSLKKTTAGAS